MRIKSYYQWEVYEIAKQLVLCQINILPRKMLYYHGQHTHYKTHRWMTNEDWVAFEDAIENALTKRTSDGRTFENMDGNKERVLTLNHTVTLTMKKLNIDENPGFIAKEYKEKDFKLVLNCTIEHITCAAKQEKAKEKSYDKEDSLKTKHIENVPSIQAKKSSQRIKEQNKIEVDENQNKLKVKNQIKKSKYKELSESDTENNKSHEKVSSRIKKSHQRTYTPEPKIVDRSLSAGKESTKKRRLYDCSKEKDMLNKWLKTKDTNAVEIEDTKTKKTKTKTSKWLETGEELERRIVLEKQQLQNNQEMTDYLRGMMKAVPEDYKFLSLMDLDKKKILKSFDKYKEDLDAVFDAHQTEEAVHGANGINHYLVINLINVDIQSEMMHKLGDAYACENASLIANVLLPEWLICLFMQHHKLSRRAALEQLKLQEEYQMHSNAKGSDFDLNPTPVKRGRR